MRKLALGAALFLLLVVGGQGIAVAQDGYPPPTTTSTTAPPTAQLVVLGTFDDGATFTAEFCGFVPGSTISVTLNGTPIGTFPVGADGCVRISVTVVEDGVVGLGSARLAAGGLQVAQNSTTPQVRINGVVYTARHGVNELVGTGTGTNGAPRSVTVRFTLGAPSSGGGSLVRTGAMILRWSLLGAALAGAGALVLLGSKRRRSTI